MARGHISKRGDRKCQITSDYRLNNDIYNGCSCCLTGICYRNFPSF